MAGTAPDRPRRTPLAACLAWAACSGRGDRSLASASDPSRGTPAIVQVGAITARGPLGALLRRDPADHASLDDPRAVRRLLGSLREAGAQEQATALADRAAAHIPLDDPFAVAGLLGSLREAGAHEQATALMDRLPGAGLFGLFREQESRQDRFRFGREADGSPAEPWGWEDLD